MEGQSAYQKVKTWRAKNKEKVAAQARRYRARHPDKVKAVKSRYLEKTRSERLPKEAEAARRRRAQDPEGQRERYERWRKKKEERLVKIAGRPRAVSCEICNGSEGGIVFDHCHLSGQFRGWICDRCNKTLGLVKDSTELLASMAKYLENANGNANDAGAEQAA